MCLWFWHPDFDALDYRTVDYYSRTHRAQNNAKPEYKIEESRVILAVTPSEEGYSVP
jgi:hypothetical protein